MRHKLPTDIKMYRRNNKILYMFRTMSRKEIAEEMGISSTRVGIILRKLGVKKQSRKPNIKRQKSILKMRREGYSLQQIGEIFNISRERVRQIEYVAKKRELETNKPIHHS